MPNTIYEFPKCYNAEVSSFQIYPLTKFQGLKKRFKKYLIVIS